MIRRILILTLLLFAVNSLFAKTEIGEASKTLEEQLYEQGQDFKSKNRDVEALINFQRVVLINPDNMNAQMFCGVICHRLRYYASAVEYYKKAVELSKGGFPSYLNLAVTYVEIGCDSLALEYYARTKKTRRGKVYAETYTNSGALFILNGRYDEAMSDFRRALQIDPQRPYARYCIGLIHEYTSQPDSAMYYFDKTIELFPDYVMPYMAKSKMLKKQKRPQSEVLELCQKAVDLLSEGLKHDTNRRGYEYYILRAGVYRQMGEKEKMRNDLKTVIEKLDYMIELHPRSSIFFSDRGSAFSYMGDKEAARRDFERAIELGPCKMVAKSNLDSLLKEKTNEED